MYQGDEQSQLDYDYSESGVELPKL